MGFKLKTNEDTEWYPDKGGVIKDARRPWIVNAFFIWALNALVLVAPVVGIMKGVLDYRRMPHDAPTAAMAAVGAFDDSAETLRCRYSWKALQCEPAEDCKLKGLRCKPKA